MSRAFSIVSLFLSCASARIAAQSYFPETEYHDCVQRVFVVETARVLAWWMDPSATNLAEVAYTVTTKADETTVWEIRWLDPAGKPIKTATVSYPANALKAGPEFYRSVFEQLWKADWKNSPQLDRREVVDGFWRGAAKAGLSREENLRAAFDLVRSWEGTSEREWKPQLAGLLIHATLPAVSDRLSLDSVVLARGAVWLAMSEHAASSKLDALWAPVLFQAGRERAAAQLWQKEFPSTIAQATPQQSGWNLWLRRPNSKDVYLFATDSTNLPMAVPMMAYDVKVNQTGRLLADLIEEILGSEKNLPRLHNYAPLFARSTTISGGHILNGAWPMFSRFDWMHLLTEYAPTAYDYRGYVGLLKTVTNALSSKPNTDQDSDLSVVGLREAAPLLRLGRLEGVGPLTPTPVVTARDLLNYGWEMTGLQMGRRYDFVRRRWGLSDLAESILKSATGELDGLIPFFLSYKQAGIANYNESVARLELLDGLFPGEKTGNAGGSGGADLNAARLCVKRSWLRPGNIYGQAMWLRSAQAGAEITELIDRLRQEGGALAEVEALRYLDGVSRDGFREIPRAAELSYALADALPQPSELYVRSVYNRNFRDVDNFTRAWKIEQLYWQNPDSELEDRVFRNYVVSGSFKSARRFYSQARENFTDPVRFSNGMGKSAYILGYCLNDEELRRMALEDSNSGSQSDMIMHIWDAAVGGRTRELEAGVREMIDRYEREQGVGSFGRRLLNFLPLLPALGDPKHSSRQEALRYFGKSGDWTVLQWIWIEKYKLSAEDAIVFLGGRENDLFRQVMICYLENDRTNALETLNKFSASRGFIDERTVLADFLYTKFHPLSPPHQETDLKPPGSISVRKAVLAKLNSRRP